MWLKKKTVQIIDAWQGIPNIRVERNLPRDRNNLIRPHHKWILFVAIPNSLAEASFDFSSSLNNVHFAHDIVTASPRRACVPRGFFALWAGLRYRYAGVRTQLLYNTGLLSYNYFTRHTRASKQDRDSIQTQPLFGQIRYVKSEVTEGLLWSCFPYLTKWRELTVQAHITSSFYIGIIIKLRLNSPVDNLHGISIGCFHSNGIQNLTKVADPNGY